MIAGAAGPIDNTARPSGALAASPGAGATTDVAGIGMQAEGEQPEDGTGWLIVALLVLLMVITVLVIVFGTDPQGACDTFYDTGTSAVQADNGQILCR
jgi:hypothetical protein